HHPGPAYARIPTRRKPPRPQHDPRHRSAQRNETAPDLLPRLPHRIPAPTHHLLTKAGCAFPMPASPYRKLHFVESRLRFGVPASAGQTFKFSRSGKFLTRQESSNITPAEARTPNPDRAFLHFGPYTATLLAT